MARSIKQVLLLAILLIDVAFARPKGRATYYTSPNNGGNQGSCGYGTISSRFPTGRMFAAWPDNSGYMCGKCVEVTCSPVGTSDLYGSYYSFTANVCKGGSVVVMITDNCPKNENQRWCSGDVPHLDLSYEAFSAIAEMKGIMSTEWSIVPCPGGTWQPPSGCTQVLRAFDTCGGGGGPFAGKCCGRFLSCQQQHQYHWECKADPNGNWNTGGSTPPPSTSENRRQAYRAPKTRVVRRTPASSGGCRRISKYRQCGGLGGPTGNKRGGRDGLWGGYCCAAGRCQRYNNWFWQCQ